MALIKLPSRIFRSKKSRSVSKSASSSFGSASSSSSSSENAAMGVKTKRSGSNTPKSVIPTRSRSEEIVTAADEWYSSELVQAFKLMDRDGDGKITCREMAALLSGVGKHAPPSEEELTAMIAEIDRDGDGCISLEEFAAVSVAFKPAVDTAELRETFEFFDADHDGRITAEELQEVFAAIGDDRCTIEECRRMIECVDNNGDGFVCFEDFTRMMDFQIC